MYSSVCILSDSQVESDLMIEVLLDCGKTLEYPITHSSFKVAQLQLFLSVSEDKLFRLFINGAEIHEYQTITPSPSEYVVAVEVPVCTPTLPVLESKEQVLEYLQKEGVPKEYLQSVNVNPKQKQDIMKNVLFTNHLTKQFVFKSFEARTTVAPEKQERMLREFVDKHVVDEGKSKFGDLSKDLIDVVQDNIERVIKMVMN